MAYTAKLWNERVRSRIDIAGQIIHLTRSATINGTKISALQSTNYAEASISDYDERRAAQLEFWKT
jgi:hypothetical protein